MKKIAIIGTGISGMAAAYLLNPRYDITVYEKEDVIGGHTRTRTVTYDSMPIAVDTGFIVYNERNYPHLTAMFKHLDVATHKSDMTFAISVNDGALEWGARDLNAVFGQRRNFLRPGFYRLLYDVFRFNRHAVATVASHPELTLGGLIEKMHLGEWFINYYILPMGGAIWSCPPSMMLDFPAQTFIRFFQNHGLLSISGQPQWYTVTGGAMQYIRHLTAPYAGKIRTRCGAQKVECIGDRVRVTDTQGGVTEYDEVILACHADQALRLIVEPTADEQKILSAFSYQKNHAVLHRDVRFMPKHKACWASWVYNAETNAGKETAIGVTYWMNLLQSIDNNKPLFVTLNPTKPLDDALVFDRHDFEHPVFTRAAIEAQGHIPSIQGKRHLWFCGAWQRYGFHEDGLQSAVKMAEMMGVPIPWL